MRTRRSHQRIAFVFLTSSASAALGNSWVQKFSEICPQKTKDTARCLASTEKLKSFSNPIDGLRALLKDKDWQVAVPAASVIAQTGDAGASAVPELIEACQRRLQGAPEALASVGATETGVRQILQAIENSKPYLSVDLFEALKKMGARAKSAVPQLRQLSQSKLNIDLRRNAEATIKAITGDKSESTIATPFGAPLANAIEDYNKARQKPETVALEAYLLAQKVLAHLGGWLGDAPEAEKRSFEKTVPGIRIGKGDSTFEAQPDLGFFKSIAQNQKDTDGVQFFTLLEHTFPEAIRRVYESSASDFGPCVSFGKGLFTKLLEEWQAFPSKNVKYQAQADVERAQILADLTTSRCVCEPSATSVVAELEQFLKIFPASPYAQKVKDRLQAVKSGAAKIKYGCVPG